MNRVLSRKDLEIILTQQVDSFEKPILELEQYQTPPRVAANLIFRANMLGDIENKNVIDICAGTGILGIAALLMKAKRVTFIEKDKKAAEILRSNIEKFENNFEYTIKEVNVFEYNSKELYDTSVTNPPFGIQQKKHRDKDFLKFALSISQTCYSIHDGYDLNQEFLVDYVKQQQKNPLEYYYDEFPLKKSYQFHKKLQKINKVLVLRSGQ